jgi:predicted glutamine amidotransferase
MCELFAMASRHPTRVTFSFSTFMSRGGGDAPHGDGWGVAFHHGADARVVREVRPAHDSPQARLLERDGDAAAIVVSHVRLATHGDVCLANTQPFQRELAGRRHLFAHNGHVPTVADDARFSFERFRAIGGTDSERCFCALLERLAPAWQGPTPPSLARRLDVVSALAEAMREHGPANFVYSDGEVLFVHADRRTQPSGAIEPPGLHLLERQCAVDRDALSGIAIDDTQAPEPQQLVLVASRPLSDEPWRPLEQGTVLALRDGAIV